MLLTECNYTLTDVSGLSRKDPRPPTSTYLELVRGVGTFCALVRTLFGDKYDYFQNLFDLWNMLNSEQVYAKSDRFGPQMVRQITWAIIEDSHQFFFRTLTEEELAIGTDVSKAVEIRLGNFPDKWKHETAHFPGARTATSTVSVPTKHPAQQPTTTHRTWGTTLSLPPTPVQSAAMERLVIIWQEDVHPIIKMMMEDYVRHFRSVQLRMLCKASGITENELPMEPKYVRNGKNMLCYSYVLAKCNGKYCGRAAEGHVPVSELSASFVEKPCTLLGQESRRERLRNPL
jgi:hypothetical protein